MSTALLFQGRRFYLPRTLSAEEKEKVEQLITQNGGAVLSKPPIPGDVTQLVNCEKLDANHLKWVSTNYVKDSVAFGALQDKAKYKYSGKVSTAERAARRGIKTPYTVEDDAKMLQFVKARGWTDLKPVAPNVWKLAENDRVTSHSWQSMHEHFRKKLQRKTPIEQRAIMTKAEEIARARLTDQGGEMEEQPARAHASPSPTGFRDVVAPECSTSMQSRPPSSAGRQRSTTPETSTIETQLKEVEEQKLSGRVGRTRPRKPMSPLRVSQRLQRSEGFKTTPNVARENVDQGISSRCPTAPSRRRSVTPTRSPPAVPATPDNPAASPSPPASVTQSTGRKQQKRKRNTPTASQKSSPSHQEAVTSDVESVGDKTRGNNCIFFRSVWTELAKDQSKRRMLQRFFVPPSTSAVESTVSDRNGSDTSATACDGGTSSGHRDELQETRTVEVEQATDEETDDIICQLQIDTHEDLPSVVHALYYYSGDVELAKSFLKGTSPPGMWCPEDDLLLVDLVADESTNFSVVDAAVARGDFASMQVSRDTDAILKRVQFLR